MPEGLMLYTFPESDWQCFLQRDRCQIPCRA